MGDRVDPGRPATPPVQPAAPDAPSKPSGVAAFLAQYAAPTVVASLIASAISVYTAVGAAQEKQREYNTKFQELVTSADIRSAFGGSYVDETAKDKKQAQAKEYYLQSVREQRATATLLSLQSVADSENQRRTVLLIGARLLNADPGYTGTGGPAARLLTVLIDQADSARRSWNPWEREKGEHLWETINAQSFRDLVTASYPSDYYNDDFSEAMLPFSTTLNGDAPITTDPKFQILHKLTPDRYEGWVHVATFAYNFPRNLTPHAAPGAGHGSAPALTPKVASDVLNEVVDVTVRRSTRNIGAVLAQYAAADPRDSTVADPRFLAPQIITASVPKKLIMLKHRLLRDRPPVQYINPDGKFRKGSLGKILGAVAAGSCVTVQEPFVPVLVFVPTVLPPPPPPKPPAKPTPEALSGRVHMWARVQGSSEAERCLLEAGSPRPALR